MINQRCAFSVIGVCVTSVDDLDSSVASSGNRSRVEPVLWLPDRFLDRIARNGTTRAFASALLGYMSGCGSFDSSTVAWRFAVVCRSTLLFVRRAHALSARSGYSARAATFGPCELPAFDTSGEKDSSVARKRNFNYEQVLNVFNNVLRRPMIRERPQPRAGTRLVE